MARRIYRGLAKAMLLATAIVVIIIVAAALAYLMSHTHESITKPSLSTTTTSTSLNALLTRYSSPNFVMHAINGNAIVISNYDENVTLKIPVSRVVAMNTVALQILIDIGAGGDVVGIEGYASQLPWLFGNYTALPAVSSGMWSVNYEEIVSLSPDLVITWSYILPQVRQKLGVFNIPVIAWGSNDNLTSLIIALGVATNHTGKALA
ncbi:ABC transporter substrate-binding protein [Vulcanisaeta sp. JCM 16161]|uniref:ABC transporter substrate-binding protein n=1 Tax=Vulcanisaeta sp. JCM 16161 TaxID=1295372 RepID=UPI0006D0D0BA|nr:ABC transporter substrate-binding protein [Vulcanisaeta sp. JCM 16161]